MLYRNQKLLLSSKTFSWCKNKTTILWMKILNKFIFIVYSDVPQNHQYCNNCNYSRITNRENKMLPLKYHFRKIRPILTSSNLSYSTNCTIGRHMYHEDSEKGVNKQITSEFTACLAYLSMACYFGRTDIALPGSYAFFMFMHKEEHDHALSFIKYQNLRGGHVELCPIPVPENQDWGCIHNALEASLKMEKLITEKLIDLHKIAEKHEDIHLQNFITSKFLNEQECSICELARLITRLKLLGSCGTALYLFDKELYKNFGKKGQGKCKEPY